MAEGYSMGRMDVYNSFLPCALGQADDNAHEGKIGKLVVDIPYPGENHFDDLLRHHRVVLAYHHLQSNHDTPAVSPSVTHLLPQME